MAKLTDAELASRVRQRNAARSERRRERLAAAGRRQLVCWITDTTRTALELEAAGRGLPVGQTAAALLAEALNAATPAERLAAAMMAVNRADFEEAMRKVAAMMNLTAMMNEEATTAAANHDDGSKAS
jgi:hypothetical protein